MDTSLSVTSQPLQKVALTAVSGGKTLASDGKILPSVSVAARQADTAMSERAKDPAGDIAVLARTQARELEQAASQAKVVEQLNSYLKDIQRDLQFSVDRDTGRTILKVIHTETGEVIRQVPPEELLNLVRVFTEGTGSLIQDKA